MRTLFVGDINNELAQAATRHDASARLVTEQTLTQDLQQPWRTLYTSLADVGLSGLVALCRQADVICYQPPETWSDLKKSHSEQRHWSEYVLRSMMLYKTVQGLTHTVEDLGFASSMMSVKDQRRSSHAQIWAVGGSITCGTGVEMSQAWPNLVSHALAKAVSLLAEPGSSLIWQSDQICRSDVRRGDIVMWDWPGSNRLPFVQQGQLLHVNVSAFDRDPGLQKKISPDLLDDENLRYQNILAMQRVQNFCDKAGAVLLVQNVMYDFDGLLNAAGLRHVRPTRCWPESFMDLASDQEHPGPKQHAAMASVFQDMLQESTDQCTISQ